MSATACPAGGTHVWPREGTHYDDGRCLKCDRAKAVLGQDHLRLLAGLVRTELRKKERGLERFRPRPDQPVEEAEEGRRKIERKIVFLRETLDAIKVGLTPGH